MKINRNIEQELIRWKDSKYRKPLILRGARQVGKTFIVEEFAKNFPHFIVLNLERPGERRLFDGFNTGKELFERIQLYKGVDVKAEETLLFIDEIQNSAEAVKALRYFYEDVKELGVLAAGSLLEVFSKREGFSFPVGRVRSVFMYPVNFKEFLDYKNPPLSRKLGSLELGEGNDLHQMLMEAFYEYAFIGGMPEVLKVYLETGSYSQVREVYGSILHGYIEDVEKYSNIARTKYLIHAIENAPLHVSEQITYEKFGDSLYRSREMKEAFDTLARTLLIHRARPSSSMKIPVIEQMRRSPKLFFLDVGLVNFRVGFREFFSERQLLDQVYQGRIVEQVVAQELLSQTYQAPQLHFWNRDKGQAEVDFLYPFKDMLIPIEVKNGAVGKLKSLFQFVEKSEHPYAIRVYSGENRTDEIKLPSGKTFYLHSIPFYFLPRLDEVLEYLVNNYK